MAKRDTMRCEHCGSDVDCSLIVAMEDCYFCADCYEQWRMTFLKCEHSWKPHANEYGEPGQYCERCNGVVRDEDFVSLGLKHPTISSETPEEARP